MIDRERLEELKSSKEITGYVCLITNMKGFWNGSPKTKKAKDFELKDGTAYNGNYWRYVDGVPTVWKKEN